MLKSLLRKCISYFVVLLTTLFLVTSAQAVVQPASQQQVSAHIGAFYLNLSGFIAPNASVVLTSDNIVLRSTVADENGYFYITGVLINQGFSSFCLDAIDFKRLGESYTCFAVPPANDDITMSDIFLPPTFGLQRSEITIGEDAVIWGFSMPNAQVIIHASDGNTYRATADNSGYYQVNFKIASPGTYEVYADASYQNRQSEVPNKKVTLTALSATQNIVNQSKKIVKNAGKNAVNKAGQLLTGSPWWWLLLVLPLLIAIFLLLKKLKPEWFTFIDVSEMKLFSKISIFKKKTLHHAWFVGY